MTLREKYYELKKYCDSNFGGLEEEIDNYVDYLENRDFEIIYNFFLWFRSNGENFIDLPIERMIEIYLGGKNE